MNDRKLLDFLCWKHAMDAERFYPPKETARECILSIPDDRYDEDTIEEARAFGLEWGQHSRAVVEAQDFFKQVDVKGEGIGPVERVKRHVKETNEEHDMSLDVPSFEWWDDD